MGGGRAVEEILAQDQGARVILASGYAAGEQVRGLLKDGAAAFVAKPFKKADLLVTVRKVLDKEDPRPKRARLGRGAG